MSKLIFYVVRDDELADFLIVRDSKFYNFNNYGYYSNYEVLARIKKDASSNSDSFKRIGIMSIITNGMKTGDKEPLHTILRESSLYPRFTELPGGCCSSMTDINLATNLFLLLDFEQRKDFLNSMKVAFSCKQAKSRFLSWYIVDHTLFRTDGDSNKLYELERKSEMSRKIMECAYNIRTILQCPLFEVKDLCEKITELYGD